MKRHLYRATLGLFTVAVLALASPAVHADLVDLDWEDPGAAAGSFVQYTTGQIVDGWTVTGVDVLVMNTTYAEPGVTFNAHHLSNALDITGAGNSSPFDGVTQNLALTIGTMYELRFCVGRADDGGLSGNYNTQSTIGLDISNGVFSERLPITSSPPMRSVG